MIGAGFAGISAARALRDAEFQVYIYTWMFYYRTSFCIRILVLNQVNFAGYRARIT